MGKYIASSLTLCSVYPMKLGPERRPYNPERGAGTSLFSMAAAPNDGHTLLTVYDCWQLDRNWNYMPSDEQAFLAIPIPADQVASDLITAWTSGLLTSGASGGHPGVGILAGETPTKDELHQLRSVQQVFFDGLFYDGQRLAQNEQWKNITELHRKAAMWLGKDAPWSKSLDPSDSKDCPACRTKIHALAIICPNCHFQVAEIPEELARFEKNAKVAAGGGGKFPRQQAGA